MSRFSKILSAGEWLEDRTASRLTVAAFVAVVAVAAAVRLPGCFGDLWLDEIWMLDLISRSKSILDVFSNADMQGYQHLNTLVLYFIGDTNHWVLLRLHSLLAGVGTVIFAWAIARRLGRLESVLAAVLTGGSYLLIHYSSEARGYSTLVFFGFGTLYALQRYRAGRRTAWAAWFWLFSYLGIFSHLLYIHVLTAAAVWLAFVFRKTGDTLRNAAARAALFCGVPVVFLTLYYGLVLRRSSSYFGAGPQFRLSSVLVKALSYSAGGPDSGPLLWVVAALTAVLFFGSILSLRRSGHDEWVFYLVVVFVSPAVLLAAQRFFIGQAEVVYERYFLLSIAFGLLSLGISLAHWLRRGGKPRIAATAVLALFLIGNAANVHTFFQYGRGSYLKAVQYMADNTEAPTITVATDLYTQTGITLNYYSRFLPPGKKMILVSKERSGSKVPMWLIMDQVEEKKEIPPGLRDPYGHAYVYVRRFPHWGLSGWTWLLYRLQE